MKHPPTPEQQAIHNFVGSGQGNLVVEALAGSGKCLGKGTPVLAFDGRILAVEDVRPGILLMGPDSEPRRVLATAAGYGPLFKITPVKGDTWVCNDVHVMTLAGTNYWRDQVRDVPLKDHLEECAALGQRPDRNWKLLRMGVAFEAKPVNLDPYLAGLWLGDGTFEAPNITNADPEIVAYCQQIASSIGVECVVTPAPRNNTNTIRFRGGPSGLAGITGDARINKFTAAIEQFKINNEKVIPQHYLTNSREVRLQLLAGLIDTDGFVSNGYVEIVSKYDRLANEILFLARSLGLAAYMRKKRATIKALSFEGIYNRITISGDIDEIPCLVPRHQSAARKQIKRVTVTGWEAKPIGDGAYYGFTLDRDGRFLLGDFTVTHNTTTLLSSLVGLPQRSILMCAFNKRIADELQMKAPKMPRTHALHIKTFHAQGLAMLRAHYPTVKIENNATEKVINRVAGQAINFKMRRAAVQLLRTIKETSARTLPPTSAEALAIGHEYDLFSKLDEREVGLAVEVVRDAYAFSMKIDKLDAIDFCDMVWLPIVLGLAPKSRYQAVFVDELQDISEPQLMMLRNLMAPGGRFVGIGDANQQIYKWRGSMGDRAWKIARDELKASFLPLTTTFRCSKEVVRQAREIVPALRPMVTAKAGRIHQLAWAELAKTVKTTAEVERGGIHTFVLSRNNSALLDAALFLWRERVYFQLNAAKELLDPLFYVLDYKLDLRDVTRFKSTLSDWHKAEMTRAEKVNATAWADRIEEQYQMLLRAVEYAKPTDLKRLLQGILEPNDSGVLLSTVHKVKGLEADRVFLLKQTFARHDERKCLTCAGDGMDENKVQCRRCGGSGVWKAKAEQEELNIEYVAITRARDELFWVDIRRDVKERRSLLPKIKSEREQLLDLGEQFPVGIPRTVGEAYLDGGSEARAQAENVMAAGLYGDGDGDEAKALHERGVYEEDRWSQYPDEHPDALPTNPNDDP